MHDSGANVGKVEASTGIEPVYTDLQSAASPLRQLAAYGVGAGYTKPKARASGEKGFVGLFCLTSMCRCR